MGFVLPIGLACMYFMPNVDRLHFRDMILMVITVGLRVGRPLWDFGLDLVTFLFRFGVFL